ncbi:MAG TPA: hypothetical protein VHN37_12660 [Actinomycetota bacterium]|nr:hypothetical protein [Actinomycetota bacterium]
MRKLFGASIVALLLGGLVLPAGAAAKPTVVFEDAAGDAGNQGSAAPGAAEAGFDLVKGEISQEKKGEVTFTVTHASMPPTNQPAEAFRFIWGLAVDGTQYEFTVKSIDVGEPDVITSALAQQPYGEERVGQVYQGVARLEECGSVAAPSLTLAMCDAKAYYAVTFTPDAGTMTWTVDTESLGAKKGSLITGGGGTRAATGCQICWVPHYLERSLTPHTIIDAATQMTNFKVKKG